MMLDLPEQLRFVSAPYFPFAPEESIYQAGEVANDLYFVADGTVEELGEKDNVGVVNQNQIHF